MSLPHWLPPMLCPLCGANVYSCVEPHPGIDIQAPGRMPICWHCDALLVVTADGRRLRVPTAGEIARLVASGKMTEIEGAQAAGKLLKNVVRQWPTGVSVVPYPWWRSHQ